MFRIRILVALITVVVLSVYLYQNHRTAVLDVVSYIQTTIGVGGVKGLAGPVQLVRVSDGDTIVVRLNRKNESIRLIGIDTPEKFQSTKLERDAAESPLTKEEIKRLGESASDITESLLIGKQIYLEFDATERDRYGRLLAYVYTKDLTGEWLFDGEVFEQVNLEIVRSGWAEPLTIPPNVRYANRYVEASREAREADKGMWRVLD